jgi:Uma2 family endonuclease
LPARQPNCLDRYSAILRFLEALSIPGKSVNISEIDAVLLGPLSQGEERPMLTTVKLRGTDFDAMVMRGAFECLPPMKIELIRGELRFMNPAGPVHEGEIEYLTRWSCSNTDPDVVTVRVQCSFNCGDNRPEPDLLWARKPASRRIRPSAEDILLVIEVSESSVQQDLGEKAELYAEHRVREYWVVDLEDRCVHVHRDPSGGHYASIQVHHPPGTISPLCQPRAELDLTDLFDLDG